jgi:hypothetical protein
MPTNAPPKAERTGETGDAGSFIPVNNPIESDHGRLKARLMPMRGLKRLRSARVISTGHAFIQISGAATTSSASMLTRSDSSWRPSPNSPLSSDPNSTQARHTRIPSTQQRRSPDADDQFGTHNVILH